MNKILTNEEELKQLKDMLEQDAKSSGMMAYFSADEPESFPCLAIYEELENTSLDFEVDEDMEIEGLDDLEGIEFEVENSYLYDFTFISQNEIKKLLEA